MKDVQTRSIPVRDQGICAFEQVRVVGNAVNARVETAPPYTNDLQERQRLEEHWQAEVIPAAVKITCDGEVTIESESFSRDFAQYLATQYRRTLRDSGLIRPESGKRYLILDWYVALDHEEAARLADVANTDKITVAAANLLHATDNWALWDDGKITTSAGLPQWAKQTRSLTQDSEYLISTCVGSDSGEPEMGWSGLRDVDSIIHKEQVQALLPVVGYYKQPTIERLEIKLLSGETVIWWAHTAGYPDGFRYDLFRSRETLFSQINQ